MKEFYVYLYLDPRKPGEYRYGNYEFDYCPFYVGKGKNGRCKDHLHKAYNKNIQNYKCNKIRKIFRETGRDPIIIKIKENMKESAVIRLEIELIKLIGRYDLNDGPLLNLTNGGEGPSGQIMSEEAKEKISKAGKGNKYHLGKKHTFETIEKISISMLGKKNSLGKHPSLETRERQSLSHKGKQPTPETIKKMSESKKGNKNAKTRSVMANFVEYSSMTEAAKDLNVSHTTIWRRICASKRGYFYIGDK